MSLQQIKDYITANGHCSALVKVLRMIFIFLLHLHLTKTSLRALSYIEIHNVVD